MNCIITIDCTFSITAQSTIENIISHYLVLTRSIKKSNYPRKEKVPLGFNSNILIKVMPTLLLCHARDTHYIEVY